MPQLHCMINLFPQEDRCTTRQSRVPSVIPVQTGIQGKQAPGSRQAGPWTVNGGPLDSRAPIPNVEDRLRGHDMGQRESLVGLLSRGQGFVSWAAYDAAETFV